MGGKKSPLKGLVDIVKDVDNKIGGGVANKLVEGASDLGKNVAEQADFGISKNVFNELKGKLSGDSIILDPNANKTQAAKDERKADDAQREQAIRDQKEAASNLTRANASNAEASKGSTIILGKKRKKNKKGSSVSGGLGLSTGSTGLQT